MEYKLEIFTSYEEHHSIKKELGELKINFKLKYIDSTNNQRDSNGLIRTKDVFYFNNEKDALWFKLKYGM